MNERILGHTCVYLATPVDFAGADDIITKLAKDNTISRIRGSQLLLCSEQNSITLHSQNNGTNVIDRKL